MSIRAILYARISTDGQFLDPQFLELRALAITRGWTVVKEIGDVISGSKLGRVGWDSMMKMVRAGAVDIIAAVKLDRIARSSSNLYQVFGELQEHNVDIVIPGQSIDTSSKSPMSKLIFGFMGLMAEFERELIRERTIAGLAAVKASGVQLGHPSLFLRADWREIAETHLAERNWEICDVLELADKLGGVCGTTAWKKARLVLEDRKRVAIA